MKYAVVHNNTNKIYRSYKRQLSVKELELASRKFGHDKTMRLIPVNLVREAPYDKDTEKLGQYKDPVVKEDSVLIERSVIKLSENELNSLKERKRIEAIRNKLEAGTITQSQRDALLKYLINQLL